MGMKFRPHELESTSFAHDSRNKSYGWSKTGKSDLSSARDDQKLSSQPSEKGLKLRPEIRDEQKASVSAATDSFGTPAGRTRQASSATDEEELQPEHSSTSSLKRNVVYQKREFFMDVEYENSQRQPTYSTTPRNVS